MSKENYELLQVSEDASDEAIEESYKALKAKYNEENGSTAKRERTPPKCWAG